jgi:hypothetical protein
MLTIIAGIFFVLHGMVHLLYAGQSRRYFELRPGLTWPDGSWLFSRLFGDPATRSLATVLLVAAAVIFLVSGTGLFFHQEWWRPAAISAVSFSSLIFILFWNSRLQALDAQGGIGLLINLAILYVILILKWHP